MHHKFKIHEGIKNRLNLGHSSCCSAEKNTHSLQTFTMSDSRYEDKGLCSVCPMRPCPFWGCHLASDSVDTEGY